MPEWILYGANGYTGALIAREAVRRGQRPILSGRNAAAIEPLARELGLPSRVASLDDPASLDALLSGKAAVLHAAGPYVHTSAPMIEACLRNGVSYLDITGEIAVFESIMRRAPEAKSSGIAMIPGVGFDVVPSDCLAARLAERMPDASELDLAFYSRGGGISRGTMRTMLEGIGEGGAVRRDGKIVRVPAAWRDRDTPFDCGVRRTMTIPWGDVSTAWHSTRIPNIRVWIAASPRSIRRLRLFRSFMPILAIAPLRHLAQWAVRNRQGPDATMRETATVHLWGQVSKPGSAPVAMTMRTVEAYRLTAEAAVESVIRTAEGKVEPGAWTPSRAFGSGFAESLGAVVRECDVVIPDER